MTVARRPDRVARRPAVAWGRDFLGGLLQDAHFAAQLARRHAAILAATVAGLGLAVGVCTATYSVVSSLLLPSFGASSSASVVEFSRVTSRSQLPLSVSHHDYLRLRATATSVALEAYAPERAPFGDSSEEVRVTLVSGGFFDTLGVEAAVGRRLTHADDSRNSPPVAVVNHNFWLRRLGGDEAVVGQTVRLLGTLFTIVGVMEDGFAGPTLGDHPPEFWAPLATRETVWRLPPGVEATVWIIGRVTEGSARERAEVEMSGLVGALATDPLFRSGRSSRIRLHDAGDRLSWDWRLRWVLAAISFIGGIVVLLACTNVANLLLAIALTRGREVGLRLALGASRTRVVRQLLTESVLLSGVASGVGIILALWSLPLLRTILQVPATVDLLPGVRVYFLLVALALTVGLGAGVAPAWHGARRGDLASPLRGDLRGERNAGRSGRARSTFVAVQTGATIILLVLTALLTRAAIRVTRVDLGFDADRLIRVTADLRHTQVESGGAVGYWERVLDRIDGIAGVERGALVLHAPFAGSYGRLERLESDGRPYSVYFNETSADFFATAGISVVEGRTYTRDEVRSGAPVAVIAEKLAGLWSNGSPVGDTLGRIDDDLSHIQVVGVVSNALTLRLDLDAALVYQPLTTPAAGTAQLIVRARGDAGGVVQPVLETARSVDFEVPLTVALVSQGVQGALHTPRMLASLMGILGLVAVLLSVTGVSAITAFAVEQRTGEIGVRMAVGARSQEILRLMLMDTLRPVGGGILFGIVAVLGAGWLLAAILHGVSPRDPVSICAAAALLLGVVLAAAVLPARRAAAVDPTNALRRI